MERLYEHMQRLLNATQSTFHRYVFSDIKWDDRMLALVGPRGVGKTTLFLQRIKEAHARGEALYVNADHMYFANHTLFDVADAFVKEGGTHLFVDEVHKYEGWSFELKVMFDSFPELHVYYAGSSVLDNTKGGADIPSRVPRYVMQGLSFREYLAIAHGLEVPAYSWEQVLANEARIAAVAHPLPLFREYLRRGYYPFGSDVDFDSELDQVISRTLEVDIPQYTGMSSATGRKLKKLMGVASSLAPFKPNMTSLGSQIRVSRNNVEEYLSLMERAGMLSLLKTGAHDTGALAKTDKVYLDNTNILYYLSDGQEDIGTVRETFFLNQARVVKEVRSSPISDFLVEGVTFEMGGKNKGRTRRRGVERDFVVRDGIEAGHGNVIPLWAFGLLY